MSQTTAAFNKIKINAPALNVQGQRNQNTAIVADLNSKRALQKMQNAQQNPAKIIGAPSNIRDQSMRIQEGK